MQIQNAFSMFPFTWLFQRPRRGRLVRDYFFLFVLLISGGLMTSGAFEVYFRYRESREQIRLHHGHVATAAAVQVELFVREIENQLKAATVSKIIATRGLSEDYRFELLKLLIVSPAISEVMALDLHGIPRVQVSRFRAAPAHDTRNFSRSAVFQQARQGVFSVGPIYFVRDSEPHTTLGLPIERFAGNVIGVLQAEVNLKSIWEVIQSIRIGERGHAYIVSRSGDLIAHPDLGLVLKRQNMAQLPQVKAAFTLTPGVTPPREMVTRNLDGKKVFTYYHLIPALDWAVFIEQPLVEAYGPLYASIFRTSGMLLLGIGIALLATLFVARRVVRPVESLREGVERIARGDLNYRLEIKTGDEVEILAEEFNNMAAELKHSYRELEEKVQARTRELSTLYDVTSTANQSLDLMAVLQAVIKKFTETFKFGAARIYLFDPSMKELHLQAAFGTDIDTWALRVFQRGQGIIGKVVETGQPMVFEDVQVDPRYQALSSSKAAKKAGWHFEAFFPIKSKGRVLGAAVCIGQEPRKLSVGEIQLVSSVLDPIGVAIENLSLFEEVKKKSLELEKANRELMEASKHKSQFLANVSHELRTPLTVIKGSIDNMLDGLTGNLNEKQARYLTRVRGNVDRLSRIINDLLDLARIEAGVVELQPTSFRLVPLITEVSDGLKQIAGAKQVDCEVLAPDSEVVAWGDRDRIAQVLTNLIGNAIKFSPSQSKVMIAAKRDGGGWIEVSVSDTGPGIPVGEKEKIFEKFYQVASNDNYKSPGIGLGLDIARNLVQMHGGRIWVDSEPGSGATFSFRLPVPPGDPT